MIIFACFTFCNDNNEKHDDHLFSNMLNTAHITHHKSLFYCHTEDFYILLANNEKEFM